MKNSHKKTIVLLDAHAIIHRAYHGMPDFRNSKGEPTGALYGICTMLLRIKELFSPEYVFACYDLPKPTFRHEAYSEYKAGRQKADDELVNQIIRSKEVFKAFSVETFEAPGFEADDLLGTLAGSLKNDFNIIIASGDMDTMQLIDGDSVQVFTLKKGITDTIIYNEQKVFERFSFLPKQIPDYKGLAGDSSDNIPGIKGIGPKTATTLITHFGSVEGIYTAVRANPQALIEAGLSPRLSELVISHEEEALFSKTIATIRLDAPVVFVEPKKNWIDSISTDALKELFTSLEFKSLLNKTQSIASVSVDASIEEKYTPHFSEDGIARARVLVWLLNSELTHADEETISKIAQNTVEGEVLEKLEGELKKIPSVYSVWKHIEEPLIDVVQNIAERGMVLDTKYFSDVSKDLHKSVEELEKEIYRLAGRQFNIGSPKQLGEVLFDELALTAPGLKKTSTGKRSTNSDTLEKLKDSHPIIEKVVSYRELQKLLSTYIDPLPELVDGESKIYPKLLQAGTTTGRFSSAEPNLQNIPTEAGEHKNVRKGFIAPDGKVFLAFDYSQIELRIAAMLSRDKNLLSIFANGEDVHASVAAQVFRVDQKEVTPEMRRHAKVINFGILYGMGVVALRQNLGTDRAAAKEFYDVYKKTFSTLAEYLERVIDLAKRNGYTETAFGRRRQIPLLLSKLPMLVAQGERMAINAPIQGTATADIIRLAMVDIERVLESKNLKDKVKMVLQVHDELLFEVNEGAIEVAIPLIRDTMETVLERHKELLLERYEIPPTPVSVKMGKNWGELKQI